MDNMKRYLIILLVIISNCLFAQKISQLPATTSILPTDNTILQRTGSTTDYKINVNLIRGLHWRGQWSVDSIPYYKNDVVFDRGTSYIALNTTTNDEPPSANWDIMSSGTLYWSRDNGHIYLTHSTDSIGIGTNTPTKLLDVNGKSIFRDSSEFKNKLDFNFSQFGNIKGFLYDFSCANPYGLSPTEQGARILGYTDWLYLFTDKNLALRSRHMNLWGDSILLWGKPFFWASKVLETDTVNYFLKVGLSGQIFKTLNANSTNKVKADSSFVSTPRTTLPATPIRGMFYYDATIDSLRVYNGTKWKSIRYN